MSNDVNINSGALATCGYQTVNMSPVFFHLIDSTYLMYCMWKAQALL